MHEQACHAKTMYVAMACNSKSHAIILQPVISITLNIGKKIAGLEIMALNQEKI